MAKMESTRKAFGETLLELVRQGGDIVALSADTATSMYTDLLAAEFPKRSWDVGIAEQNMMAMAAGIASTGKTVFATTYATFLSMRACEQIRTFIAYPNLNVKIVGGLGGFSAGIEGVTHLGVEDIGILRVIPNLTILAPADAEATRKLVRAAADHRGPVYMRIGRDPSPVVFDSSYAPRIGQAMALADHGSDIGLVASGFVVPEVLAAAEALKKDGIGATVVEVHTVKPLDEWAILSLAGRTGAVLVAEEHSIINGLGGAVCELLSEKLPTRVKRVGIPDRFTESGTPDELRDKYELRAANIAAAARDLLRKKSVDRQ